ncbi:MAG: threonine synthase [Clostridia bacterium]|nr:threonine synthase [Clostridia bacterium]
MNYVSTRGIDNEGVSSAFAIKTGLAKDGGLYMPESIPMIDLDFIGELSALPYTERAARILSLFLTDYTIDELREDAEGAYGGGKFTPEPAPITSLGDSRYMLELWHGPTSAFKDMALQIMPRLFVRALRKTGEERRALILVATSGDTGKAALEGYRDVEGTMIKVFYPTGGVSSVQKLQMQTQEGSNVSVEGIVGNFDDAQSGVKRIFSDDAIRRELDGAGVFLSSANSINWGRLVPQIVYYVSAYADMYRTGAISLGEEVDVSVPTGNFGNIFAAYIAKRMGVPIRRLVCASNKNNVLTEFFKSGVYDKNREFFTTMSPSMDILISSNLERLLYLTLGQDKTRGYMEELARLGRYELSAEDLAAISESFVGYYTDEEECQATVKEIYEKKNCLIDTHTAVAIHATNAYMNDFKAERKTLTVSTASPYKFARDVLNSLTDAKDIGDLEALEALNKLTGVDIPTPLASVLNKQPRHTGIIDRSEMEAATVSFAKS